MAEWLRRAGRGRLGTDDVVVWSVAEGVRGRRWRWIHEVHQGFLGSSGLIEISAEGRLRRLELATPSGLLTFHPEPDGVQAHGNVVTSEGVHPISTTWRPEWGIGFFDDPFGSALGLWAGTGLVVAQRSDGLVWRPPGPYADVSVLALDHRGIPVLDGGADWPLEEA